MRWYNPTEEQKLNWRRNVLNLPVELQRLAQAHPPWNLYEMPNGKRVYVVNIAENGKFRVTAPTSHNPALAQDESIGQVDPADLAHAAFLVAHPGQCDDVRVGTLGQVTDSTGVVLEFPKQGVLSRHTPNSD